LYLLNQKEDNIEVCHLKSNGENKRSTGSFEVGLALHKEGDY